MTEAPRPIGYHGKDAEPMVIDLLALRGTHLGVIANSGAGKSGLIRKLLEVTHGQIQQIVLDPDDEYYTLREGGDYIIAGGEDGDCPATVQNAADIAKMLMETGISAVIQMNHLKGEEPQEFVAAFIGALMETPRKLWHPVLLVLDEAHRFIPQDGSTAATDAVRDLFARGRKRGFTGVLATQRMASIEKSVTANMNNWALGRVGQATDRKVVLNMLGFTATSAEGKTLMALDDRVFWMFGRGVGAKFPVMMRVDDVETTIVESGEAKIPTKPAPAALKKLLEGLQKAAPAPVVAAPPTNGVLPPSQATLTAAEAAGYDAGHKAGYAEGYNRGMDVGINIGVQHLERTIAALRDMMVDADAGPPNDGIHITISDAGDFVTTPDKMNGHDFTVSRVEPATEPPSIDGFVMTPAYQKILDAVAWNASLKRNPETPISKTVLAFLVGMSAGAGGFNNYLGRLRTSGIITYPSAGHVALTAEGMRLVPKPKAISNRDVQNMAMDRLEPRQRQLLEIALEAYPGGVSKERAAEKLGMAPTAGGFNNLCGRLRSLSMIDYPQPKEIRATDFLFPEGPR